MRWYKDKPEEGDFVVVVIQDVDKNSAYADLIEYEDTTGLIHISEVSRSWIKDIRKELEEGEKTVAQVVEIDDDSINLSIKRANDNNKRKTIERWKKEQKAEEFLEELINITGRDKEELMEEVIFPMQKKLGSSFHGFEISVGKEEELAEFLDKETIEKIQQVASENIDLKQEKLEGSIELSFNQGNGLERLKETLKDVNDKEGIEVKYVSAPEYSITSWGRTSELTKEKMDNTVKSIREATEELGGKFEFKKS